MPLDPAAPGVPRSQRRTRRRKEARYGELMRAALAEFVERGFTASRAEDVAERAGVSKGTLYLYFRSKEDLFKAVVCENLALLRVNEAEPSEEFKGGDAERLRAVVGEWWKRGAREPAFGVLKIIAGETRTFPALAELWAAQVVAPLREVLGKAILRGIASGEFRRLPLDDVLYSLIAPLLFIAMNQQSLAAFSMTGEAFDVDRYISTQLELLLAGLKRTADAATRP
ncbi:TetR/AcrR family transcriptional regulator [Ramlibacter sp. WS9]|uniref:TetR/AcrR family transcriptional regulator n=1 Tax=Ramlibacter sp. WS9 TaxID=1882741 RepID=UPI0013053ABD|nr:TetR/AcrR family transcriptional regulator [Ramlibacter sp. WS9]